MFLEPLTEKTMIELFCAAALATCDLSKIKPGMPEARVVEICGEPEVKNYRGDLRAQWRYSGRKYVWVRYARLTADNELIGGRVEKTTSYQCGW